MKQAAIAANKETGSRLKEMDISLPSSDKSRSGEKAVGPKGLRRRKARPRLTNEQRVAIVKAYETGEKIESIEARFGVTTGYPGILARSAGVPVRRPRGVPRT
jgi:hypothetical protein